MASLAKLSPLEVWRSKVDLAQEISQISDRKLKKNSMKLSRTRLRRLGTTIPFLSWLAGHGSPIGHRRLFTRPTQGLVLPPISSLLLTRSLSPNSRRVFEQYTLRDTALTATVEALAPSAHSTCSPAETVRRCFFRIKEAGTSALECLGPKFEGNPGQRVADGQRILQATGDIFLGWGDDAASDKHFYVHQLRIGSPSAKYSKTEVSKNTLPYARRRLRARTRARPIRR